MKEQSMYGRVFDVERFSTKDGPGIRTVAFLKGCNLNCAWCHNQEGIQLQMELGFDFARCIGCGACFAVCQAGAHRMENGCHTLDRSICMRCFACAQACFSGAIRQIGKTYSARELAEELAQDKPYYDASGGGVTLSGGEVMMQAEFAAEVLAMLKQSGVHTAIETNLSVPWRLYEKTLPFVDLVMADVKTIREDTMQRYIQGNLQQVMENLRLLLATEKPVIIRTPVIPGVNDDPQEIAGIAQFLSGGKRLLYYELLRYHPIGTDKARLIGKHPQVFRIPSAEAMNRLAGAAQKSGVTVYVDGKQYLPNL